MRLSIEKMRQASFVSLCAVLVIGEVTGLVSFFKESFK